MGHDEAIVEEYVIDVNGFLFENRCSLIVVREPRTLICRMGYARIAERRRLRLAVSRLQAPRSPRERATELPERFASKPRNNAKKTKERRAITPPLYLVPFNRFAVDSQISNLRFPIYDSRFTFSALSPSGDGGADRLVSTAFSTRGVVSAERLLIFLTCR